MDYPQNDDALAARRTESEVTLEADRVKAMIKVTPALQLICRSTYLSTAGRLPEPQRGYILDVARGRYQTADFDRIALSVRFSSRPGNRSALIEYVRRLAESNPASALPFDRAMLRLRKEEAEAIVAVERLRFQRCDVAAKKAIDENNDVIAALHDVNRSIAAAHQLTA